MQTRRAIEIVVMGVRGCRVCEGTGLVEVSSAAPTGDCRASGLDPDSQAEVNAAVAKLEADARALWAARVSGAWVLAGHSARTACLRRTEAGRLSFATWEDGDDATDHFGPTPDAAHLAAAEAVFPTLPADVRAQLGERP
jgi:hypothetical protein